MRMERIVEHMATFAVSFITPVSAHLLTDFTSAENAGSGMPANTNDGTGEIRCCDGGSDNEPIGVDCVVVDPRVGRRLRRAADAHGVSEQEAASRTIEYTLRHHEEACREDS